MKRWIGTQKIPKNGFLIEAFYLYHVIEISSVSELILKKPEIKTESAAEQFEKSDIKPQCAVEHPDQEIQTIQPQPSSSGKNILNQKHVLDTIYLILKHQSDTFCILMENGVARL